jgi:hypothetical protein
MIKMTNKARKASENLAICYGAYRAALKADTQDINSLVLWAKLIKEAQLDTGIVLIDHLDAIIELGS